MKLLTIQDMACYGKCSGSIAMPVLSAMGIETTLLPTSVLSTHSAFKGFTFRDLLPEMEAILDHWISLDLQFDAIYIGYLGSEPQLEFVHRLIAHFPNSLIMVDPVMGDNGKLHRRMTPSFIVSYAALCQRAHLLLPNMTEACALLGQPYTGEVVTDPLPLLHGLREMGAENVVITGLQRTTSHTVTSSDASALELGAVCLDSSNEYSSYFRPPVPGHFHGTGDLFASVCIGGLLRGLSLSAALELATDFTTICAQNTASSGDAEGNHWHGLKFETCLPKLWERLS